MTLSERKAHNLALTVLYVPYSLDSGGASRFLRVACLRLKDLLGPVTRVKEKKKKGACVRRPLSSGLEHNKTVRTRIWS